MTSSILATTSKARTRHGVRAIKLRHIMGHTVDCYDDGCDERGQPNQQRQHLVAVLKKRVKLADGREVPTFVLAEEPPGWPAALTPKEAQLRAQDRFDSEAFRGMDGKWRLATPEWIAISDKIRAEDAARTAQMADHSRSNRAAKGLEALNMLSQLAKQAPAEPRSRIGRAARDAGGDE